MKTYIDPKDHSATDELIPYIFLVGLLTVLLSLPLSAEAQEGCINTSFLETANALDISNTRQKRLAGRVRRDARRNGKFNGIVARQTRRIFRFLRANQTISLLLPTENFSSSCVNSLSCIEEDTTINVSTYGTNAVKACNRISTILFNLKRQGAITNRRVKKLNGRNIKIATDIELRLGEYPDSVIQCSS